MTRGSIGLPLDASSHGSEGSDSETSSISDDCAAWADAVQGRRGACAVAVPRRSLSARRMATSVSLVGLDLLGRRSTSGGNYGAATSSRCQVGATADAQHFSDSLDLQSPTIPSPNRPRRRSEPIEIEDAMDVRDDSSSSSAHSRIRRTARPVGGVRVCLALAMLAVICLTGGSTGGSTMTEIDRIDQSVGGIRRTEVSFPPLGGLPSAKSSERANLPKYHLPKLGSPATAGSSMESAETSGTRRHRANVAMAKPQRAMPIFGEAQEMPMERFVLHDHDEEHEQPHTGRRQKRHAPKSRSWATYFAGFTLLAMAAETGWKEYQNCLANPRFEAERRL